MVNKADIGDLVEVKTPAGFSYIQYVGLLDDRLSVFRVFKALSAVPLPSAVVFDVGSSYYFATDVRALLGDNRFRIVGYSKNVPKVPAFRRGYRVIVEDGVERPIRGYTDGLLDIPEDLAVPPDYIVQRLASGWLPRDEFKKLETQYQRQGKLALRSALFWLRFERESDLASAKHELRLNGFTVERLAFKYVEPIQLKACISLGDDLTESRQSFLRAESVVKGIADRFHANDVQFLVE